MKVHDMDRRDFLKASAAAGAMAMVSGMLPGFSWAGLRSVSLEQCLQMNPEEMAQRSKNVTDSWNYLVDIVDGIHDKTVRQTVQDILDNPAPTFTSQLKDVGNRKEVFDTLNQQGFVPKDMTFETFLPPVADPQQSPHPFIAGPGSGYNSHHSYPGGLVTHTALNTRMSLALYENYKLVYGSTLDKDIVIASQVLHDLCKPWVFQWQEDGQSRTELQLAGTGEHHTYSVAESLYRGLPAELCIAQACAHNHAGWEEDESGPVNWLKTAAVLAGKDPVKEGLLAPDAKTLPLPRRMEGFVCHLADHDWVLSVPAAKWLIPLMEEIAQDRYGMTRQDLKGEKFNQFRNYVFSQASIMNLYELYSVKGKDVLTETVTSIVTA